MRASSVVIAAVLTVSSSSFTEAFHIYQAISPRSSSCCSFSSSKSSIDVSRHRRHHYPSSFTKLYSSTMQEEEVVVGSSARLRKAQLLLEQFTNDQEEVATSSSTSTSRGPNGATASTSTRRSTSKATTTTTRTSQSSINKVPDTFWSNGHLLQDSNYVTRWAKGIKVAEPLVKYDPIVAEKVLFKQPTKWLIRNVQIALPIGFWAVSVVSDYIMGSVKDTKCRQKRAKQLLKAISGLGPAIIKGGQALASRPDLLPSEYLEELQKLQDDVPRFSNDIAFRTVEQELNITRFEDVFELIQEEPIAAASIGQVYKARLLTNGNVVALKIQRPKCEEIIALDLYILRWWSGIYNQIFQFLNRDIDVQSIIDDFGELIYREIDYIAEAANAQRFNELYAGVADVFVPKIYSELTTSKVLTMEWVDGYRLTDTANLQKYNLEPSRLVNVLVQCSLKQILENGFFHADPHAGNLLACEDGRLCYLDFGMMSYANAQQRNGFLLAVVHLVNKDWSELVKLYQKLGFIPLDTDVQPIEEALENALPDVLNSEVSEVNFKNVVGKLGDIMYTYPFSLPPFYIAIIRCLGVLEGLAIQVDPKARIVSKAYPYVASRVLTDQQEDLQEALRRLALTNDGKHIRWDRLESLLEEATKEKDANEYDPAAALDIITDYLIINDSVANSDILDEITQQIVDSIDTLGAETIQYVSDALRALAINDEVALVRAFRSIQDITQNNNSNNSLRKRINDDLSEVLPEPTPSMQRFSRILGLLAGSSTTTTTTTNEDDTTTTSTTAIVTNGSRSRSASSSSSSIVRAADSSSSSNSNNANNGADFSKFVPVIRKLSQEPRVQRAINEIIARLGERVLSRSLRAAFGLPPPQFGNTNGASSSSVSSSSVNGSSSSSSKKKQ